MSDRFGSADPIRPAAPSGSGYDPETHMVTPPVPPAGAPQEPLMSTATVVTVATALLALIVALGVPVDDDTQAAILAAIAVVAPIVLALVARGKVWAPATVRATVKAEVAKAVRAQPPTGGMY